MPEKDYEIVPLPKEQWEGINIPMRYTTEEYYDVKIAEESDGYTIKIHKSQFESPVTHYPEEYDFPDKLYQPHWEKAYAWGVLKDGDGKKELLACIETCPEEWSNRLMVTELWVHESIRRQGIAHRLMAVAKEQAYLEHRRAIILETQSCNVGAIHFYQQEGFELIGMDSCCYRNNDLERREVRINMGYFPRRKQKVTKETIVIRKEKETEYHRTEEAVLRAFWNKHHPGCNEHLLVHKLRQNGAYLPELSRVAVAGDQIVGVICFARALLKKGEKTKEILTFGPLCVVPKWQGCGVGSLLLKEALTSAKEAGYGGVIIFGEPDYYPRHGFKTCDQFGITTEDGKNFDSFMGIELIEGALSGFGGKFIEPEVFLDLPKEENAAFTKQFHAPAKQRFPGQWDEIEC